MREENNPLIDFSGIDHESYTVESALQKLEELVSSQTAILISDEQVGMYQDYSEINQDSQPLIFHEHAILQLIELIKKKNGLIIFVRFPTEKYGTIVASLEEATVGYTKLFVIEKQSPDAFHGTKLQELLNDNQIQQVVVVGLYRLACIVATLYGAIEVGEKREYILPVALTLKRESLEQMMYFLDNTVRAFRGKLTII